MTAADPDASATKSMVDLRIKIWDTSKGEASGVVYDTQPGAAYNVLPTTPLGGGVALHGNAKGLKASASGEFSSPAGGYVPKPTLSGTANLSLVVSYASGAPAPTGQVWFTFANAGLTFHSTAFNTLSFPESGAQLRGSGTVNGGGSYGFLLAVADSDAVDNNGLVEVRMKIWDARKGEASGVLYDSQPGALDSAMPTTPLNVPAPPSPPPGGAANGPGAKDLLSPVTVDFLMEDSEQVMELARRRACGSHAELEAFFNIPADAAEAVNPDFSAVFMA